MNEGEERMVSKKEMTNLGLAVLGITLVFLVDDDGIFNVGHGNATEDYI